MTHKVKTIQCAPITSVQISTLNLAVYLANLSDEEQGQFFNEFDIQLSRICEINGGSKAMQLLFIRKYLTPEAMFTLADLGTQNEGEQAVNTTTTAKPTHIDDIPF